MRMQLVKNMRSLECDCLQGMKPVAMLVLYKHWKGPKEYHFSGRLARYNDWPQGCKMQLPSRAPQFIRLVPGKRVQQGPAAAVATVDWNAFNCIPCPFCTHVGNEIQELINIQCMVRPAQLTLSAD